MEDHRKKKMEKQQSHSSQAVMETTKRTKRKTMLVVVVIFVVFVSTINVWNSRGIIVRLQYQTEEEQNAQLIGTISVGKEKLNLDSDTVMTATTAASASASVSVATTDINSTDSEKLKIRSWGCDLTETPLIFVHIGKSGGGSIRARLAASATEYDRGNKWQRPNKDDHYYPILPTTTVTVTDGGLADDIDVNNGDMRRGKFCDSMYPHYTQMPHISHPINAKPYEGIMKCNATTPLGIAIACHHPYRTKRRKRRSGGIRLKHYKNTNCGACDDDYYLEEDYYFPPKSKKYKTTQIPKFSTSVLDALQDPPPGSTCDTVLTAHNNLGSELHWLPPRYLKQHWWDNIDISSNTIQIENKDSLEPYWNKLLDDRHRRRKKLEQRVSSGHEVSTQKSRNDSDTTERWCPQGYTVSKQDNDRIQYDRPSSFIEYDAAYEKCGQPLAQDADQAFRKVFGSGTNYSPFYASMPVHRVTVLRDPWSWIVSKFFWHGVDRKIEWKKPPSAEQKTDPIWLPCQHVSLAYVSEAPRDPLHPNRSLGWAEHFSLKALLQLCGDDCVARYENAMMELSDIESQASSNLQQAFSVVGILHELDDFYEMLTDRIHYLDTSLNPNVTGHEGHATRKTDVNLACKELYAHNETFRNSVRKQVPAFAAMERVYHLGVRINAFQKEELARCKRAKKGGNDGD